MAMHILPELPASDEAPSVPVARPISSALVGGSWIQASIARTAFAAVNVATMSFGETYVVARSTDLDSALRGEIAAMQLAAAQRFWAFEDSIPSAED